jgi:hypothetical protein
VKISSGKNAETMKFRTSTIWVWSTATLQVARMTRVAALVDQPVVMFSSALRRGSYLPNARGRRATLLVVA